MLPIEREIVSLARGYTRAMPRHRRADLKVGPYVRKFLKVGPYVRKVPKVVPCVITLLSLGAAASIGAQQRTPVPRAEWGKWERLVPQRRATTTGPLSPDGRWLTYGIARSDGRNELRVTNIADAATTTAAFGEQPVFSADSKWLAYAIGVSEAEEEKLQKQKKP